VAGVEVVTERRVADLIAAGRTYREAAAELFISPKTVQWNLSKVYRKLEIRSRAELPARLALQDDAD
jgi:DNA-binding CsgD family transcriptional regulator